MSRSNLINVDVPAYEGNFTYGRSGYGISAITIHHMAGVLSAEQCGWIFQTPGRYGSSHYGIGNDGRIGLYVDEDNTAWTNSNWESNCQSVTIETSNCATGGDWPVSDAALDSLIKLVADIAKRNNLGHLVSGQNLTWHSMFAATECPGPYLLARIDYIAQEANKINEGQPVPPEPTPTPSLKHNVGEVVTINGIYISSDSIDKLVPLYNQGTITYRIEDRPVNNPYLLNNGDLGWANDDCIIDEQPQPVPQDKYLNLNPEADTWTVYKTNDYYMPGYTEDVAGILAPSKFGGLTYKILEDMGNYHFKIETAYFGIVYISGNIDLYPCTITNEPVYENGNY